MGISNTPNNLNISAYRVLYLFKILCHWYELSHEELNRCLIENALTRRALKHETIMKHFKTLELSGCKISRTQQEKRCYRLKKHPLQLRLTEAQTQLIYTLLRTLENQPFRYEFKTFCRLITHIAGEDVLNRYALEGMQTLTENPAFWESWREKVEHFARYCQEGLMLELGICTASASQEERKVLLEPQGLVYQRKRVYLVGIEYKTQKKMRFFLGHVRSHRQLPSQVRSASVQTTVVFELTNRIAKSYRPYPGERIQESDEKLTVTHKTDDVEQLIKRLIKYGPHCRIVSPEWVGQEMVRLLKKRYDELTQPTEPIVDTLLSKAQTDESLHKWVCHLDTPRTLDDARGD